VVDDARRPSGEPVVLRGVPGVRAAAGRSLGTSAEVVVAAPAAGAPAALPTAHGGVGILDPLLVLGLGPALGRHVFRIVDVALCLNYGYDRVAFSGPVAVGSRVRMEVRILGVTDARGGVDCRFGQRFLIGGSTRAVCTAENIIRVLAPA
jgi:acyl dehydratase